MPQRLKVTPHQVSEDKFTDLNEKLKVEMRKMAHDHLACQESELVMQSYGMSAYWWNVIHDKKAEVEETVKSLEKLNKQLDDMCKPFGGIDKVEEIFKNVDEVEANFTCSDEDLDYYIFNRDKVDEAHRAKLKKLKVVDGLPQAECPNCKTLSPLSFIKCPNCGLEFEEETK